MGKKIDLSPVGYGPNGMALIEVLIAMTLFAVFVTVFVLTNATNLKDSANFKDEMRLRDLGVSVINEILINPPELTEALTLSPKTKTFDNEPNYSYSITWKKFELPDYTKMMGEDRDDPQAQFQKKVFEQVKENMEKLVWQLAVEIKNSDTNMTYRLATWLYNHEAKVSLTGF